MSPTLGPQRNVSPRSVPVIPTSPPIAWATTSNAGQSRYGLAPVRGSPNPRIAAYTRRGLRSCNVSQPSPRRSITPALEFSTNTSAESISRSIAERSVSAFRSSTTLRLLRLMLAK